MKSVVDGVGQVFACRQETSTNVRVAILSLHGSAVKGVDHWSIK
jgi:hypothetical protein